MIQIKKGGAIVLQLVFSRPLHTESSVSAQQATASLFPREEALSIASLLAFIGGYLKAYTWIVHHVFTNAQSANLVFLWGLYDRR